eukprot:338886_1
MDNNKFDISWRLLVSGMCRLSANITLSENVVNLLLCFLISLFQSEIKRNELKKLLNKTTTLTNVIHINGHQFKFVLRNNDNDMSFGIVKIKKYDIHNVTMYFSVYCKQLNYKYKACKKFHKKNKYSFWSDNISTVSTFQNCNNLTFEIFTKILFINTSYEYNAKGFSWSNKTLALLQTNHKIWSDVNIDLGYKWKLDRIILTNLINKNNNDILYFSNNFGNYSFCLYLMKQKKRNDFIKLGLRLLKFPDTTYIIKDIKCIFKLPHKNNKQKILKQINKKKK